MINKMYKELWIDFDETATNSLEKFIYIYNQRHNTTIDYKKIRKYDFTDEIPTITKEEINDIFESEEFFDNLTLKDNCYDVLKSISQEIPIYLVTIGSPKNLYLKSLWMEKNLNFVHHYYLLHDTERNHKIDKRFINMENGIFIDDVSWNLDTSNAKLKILFKNTDTPAEWNFQWNKKYITDWKQLL